MARNRLAPARSAFLRDGAVELGALEVAVLDLARPEDRIYVNCGLVPARKASTFRRSHHVLTAQAQTPIGNAATGCARDVEEHGHSFHLDLCTRSIVRLRIADPDRKALDGGDECSILFRNNRLGCNRPLSPSLPSLLSGGHKGATAP